VAVHSEAAASLEVARSDSADDAKTNLIHAAPTEEQAIAQDVASVPSHSRRMFSVVTRPFRGGLWISTLGAVVLLTIATVSPPAGARPSQEARQPTAENSPFSSKPSPARFTFAKQKATNSGVPGPGYDSLPLALFSNCPWPPDKSSISIKAASAEGCHLLAKGQTFGLLESPIGGAKIPKQSGSLTSDVRFARLDKARGVIDVSGVLMEYGEYSGGVVPDAVRYRSSVWLFDCCTEKGSEVLRLAAATGKVLQRTIMPNISRPVIGANASGFWMGQAGSSLYPSGVKLGIWLASVGATHGIDVRATDDVVYSMASQGTSMRMLVGPRPVGSPGYRWTFTPISPER
jgi:hypothetical protein